MKHDFFELSLRDEIPIDELRKYLKIGFSGRFLEIIDYNGEYWDIPLEESQNYFAMEVFYAPGGFKTFVKGIFFGEEIPGVEMENIARYMAKMFNTDTAIGDFVHEDPTDRFIVYMPDGKRKFGVDAGLRGIFDVKFSDEEAKDD